MASPDSSPPPGSPTPPATLPLRATSFPSSTSAADAGPSADYRILTPERVGLQYATAGIGSRSAAALVDSLLQFLFILLWGVVIFIAVISLPPVTRQRIATTGTGTAVTWIFVGVFLVGFFLILFAYFVLFEILWNGQTPGKRMLGLRVIRENGYPLRAVDAVVRNLVRIVDALPTGYAIGLLVMLLNARSKRLGDFAAGTIVVREDSRPASLSLSQLAAAATAPEAAPDSGDYRLPTLRPEHATLVRDFLLRRDSLDPIPRRQLASRLADIIAAHYHLESLHDSESDEPFLERFR